MLLAIDPGRDSGWSLWRLSDPAYVLVDCGYHLQSYGLPHRECLTRVVVESQAITRGRTRNPASIIALAHDAGERIGAARALGIAAEYVDVATWKGAVPKEVHHPRILRRLTAAERLVVQRVLGPKPSMAKREAVLDAVGIGLWAVGRRA